MLVALLLAAVTLVLYLPLTDYPFLDLDDGSYVTENPRVRAGLTGAGVRWAFTAFHGANWHPLTWLSHMLDCEWFGLDAGRHHATNVLLHALNAVLLLLALRSLTGSLWKSAAVAAFFALHPLRLESVAWISERKDLLAGLFWILTLLFYARYARRPSAGRYLPVALAFAAGLMSKPMLVSLPFVLLLLDVWPLRRCPRPARLDRSAGALVVEKIPLLAMTLASAGITLAAQAGAGAVRSFETLPIGSRLANALVSYVAYILDTLWPAGLAIFYPHPAYVPGSSLPLPAAAAGAGLLLALVTAVATARLRRAPYLAVGWYWYVISLLPVIGWIQVGAQARADRYTYLPSIGLLLAAVWGLHRFCERRKRGRRVFALVVAPLLIACVAATWVQRFHWRDSSALFEHAIRVTRDNYLAHNALARTHIDAGRLDEAARHLTEAIRIMPRFAEAHDRLGVVRVRQGAPDEAAEHFRSAIRVAPDYAPAHANLGALLARGGELVRAAEVLEGALRIDPQQVSARVNLALVQANRGQHAEAARQFRRVLESHPDRVDVRVRLGTVLALAGDPAAAKAELEQALRLQPDHVDALHTLGSVLARQGDLEGAEERFRRVLELSPGHREARDDLEAVRAMRAGSSARPQ